MTYGSRRGHKYILAIIIALALVTGMAAGASAQSNNIVASKGKNLCKTHGFESTECRSFLDWTKAKGFSLTPGLITRILSAIDKAKPGIYRQAKSFSHGRRLAFMVAQRVVLQFYQGQQLKSLAGPNGNNGNTVFIDHRPQVRPGG